MFLLHIFPDPSSTTIPTICPPNNRFTYEFKATLCSKSKN